MACVAVRSVVAAGGRDFTRPGCASFNFMACIKSTTCFPADVRIARLRGAASMAACVVTPVTRVGAAKTYFRVSTCHAPKASGFCSATDQEAASSSKTENKIRDMSTSSTAEQNAASSTKGKKRSVDADLNTVATSDQDAASSAEAKTHSSDEPSAATTDQEAASSMKTENESSDTSTSSTAEQDAASSTKGKKSSVDEDLNIAATSDQDAASSAEAKTHSSDEASAAATTDQEAASSSKAENESSDTSTSSAAKQDAASSTSESVDEAVLGPPREDPFPLPAAWRDPAEWVDLEFTRAGLDPDFRQDKSTVASPWGQPGFEHPDSNVLWPHKAISEHRSRPFTLPRGHTPEVTTDAAEQLEMNRSRLTTLWRMSASHGISWDELDDAYVCFAQDGKQRYDDWSRKSDVGIMAVYEKDKARERAVRFLRRYCGKGSKGPEERFPSAVRRLHARLYTRAKKEWLAPFRPGKLSKHLQQLVAARMLRRETHERALGLVGSKAKIP